MNRTLNFCKAIKKIWQQVKNTNPKSASVITATDMDVSWFLDKFTIGTIGQSKFDPSGFEPQRILPV